MIFTEGDRVMVVSPDCPAFLATVVYKTTAVCIEHDDPVYRCEFMHATGVTGEGDFCENCLTLPNVQ